MKFEKELRWTTLAPTHLVSASSTKSMAAPASSSIQRTQRSDCLVSVCFTRNYGASFSAASRGDLPLFLLISPDSEKSCGTGNHAVGGVAGAQLAVAVGEGHIPDDVMGFDLSTSANEPGLVALAHLTPTRQVTSGSVSPPPAAARTGIDAPTRAAASL
ncbi:hypothetical protein [Streptomyces sp. IMTB 2501]|uniref:hypothetical protein n=1 Tax=Streptomyces sp. IMTB 2501 TaxID=1776340 RepID=UPI0015B99F20|nr:hypothetical protein [Streptomyces sp. IMTB 2501]